MLDRSISLEAEVYRALHTGTFGDQQFYVSLVQKCVQLQPTVEVLELGCGSGRILKELVKLGATVTGLDISAEALNLCREALFAIETHQTQIIEKTKLIESDFKDLNRAMFGDNFDGFDLILITYNGLYCLPTLDAQIKLIRDSLDLLKPSGELWCDGYALPDPTVYEYESSSEYSPLTVIELPASSQRVNRTLGVEELDVFDLAHQRLSIHYRYVAPPSEIGIEPLHNKVEVIEHRYIYPWQVSDLVSLAGGHVQTLHTYFGSEPLSNDQKIRDLDWGIEWEHWIAAIKKNT